MKVSKELIRYLSLKGLKAPEAQRRFLFPKVSDHYDPFLMDGMAEAVEELIGALKGRKKVMVWGHADLDGIASVAMLKSALEDLGAEEVALRIPVRNGEGFGLISQDLHAFRESGGDLIVTVDVGVTNVEEARLAQKLGLGLIITDHHEFLSPVPEALIVDPKQPASSYPWRELAGAGVVLKLVSALYQRRVGLSVEELARLRPCYWMFAALGTVSDRCPLVDENRLIITVGLGHLRAGEWPSLEIWLDEMGLDAESLTVFDLYSRGISAFYASDPEEGVRLLLSKDREWLRTRYAELKELALAWQRGKQRMIEEARGAARKMGGMIVAASDVIGSDYLGTTAHALREQFGLPAIVLAPGKGLWHAECRGFERIDLLSYLAQFQSIFLSFGGHRKACGFTLKPEKLGEFFSALEEHPLEVPSADDREEPCFELELGKDLREWTLLAPFGEGNPPPRLAAKGVRVKERSDGCRANGIQVYLPIALHMLPRLTDRFDMEYTIQADGTIRVLSLEPLD